MVKVIGVKFKTSGRIYYFDPLDLSFEVGDGAIVETARGLEYGDVVAGPKEVEESEIVAPLKPVLRVATDEDKRLREMYAAKEPEAFAICERKIAEHELDMKLVNAEYIFNGSKIVFYFTSDERVDFRELVKDLAFALRTRIELRQIGVRDEAKMLGGLGPCGRPVCCKSFLDDFRPVSIKMAKEQNLSLSPTKISGLCGRLMCCLQYEQNVYEGMKKVMPKTGKEINTIDGVGVVVENNAITERTKVRLTMDDGTIDVREYPYTHLGPVGEPLPEEALRSAEQRNELSDFAAAARRENGAGRNGRGRMRQNGKGAQPVGKQDENRKNGANGAKNGKPAQKNGQKPGEEQDAKKNGPKPNDGRNGQRSGGQKQNGQKPQGGEQNRGGKAGGPKPQVAQGTEAGKELGAQPTKKNNRRRRHRSKKHNGAPETPDTTV